MPVTVHDFSEAELWYIYEALTTQSFVGATQTEMWEIFNGTNPQGLAVSLFNSNNGISLANQLSETLSGADITIANLLVETLSGSDLRIANVAYNSYTKLNSIDNKVSTSANQTTANNYLNLIDAQTSDIASHTQTTNTYLSTIRTPVLTSITGNLTIAVQVHNLSVYNSGASAGTINVGGGGAISIPAGVTVNYDAGGNNNRYAANSFVLNATGTTFIVSYTS